MTKLDTVVMWVSSGTNLIFTIAYLCNGQWLKALYWGGAVAIAASIALMKG